MKTTLFLGSIVAVAGFCTATPYITQRCGSNATIASRSSLIGHDGHELQITTSWCANPRRSINTPRSGSEHMKRATCIPDPSTCFVESCLGATEPPNFAADCKTLLSSVVTFAPDFAVLLDQVIFITFNTCMLDFGVGPQTSDICGVNWGSVGASILSRCPGLGGGEAVCNSGAYDINIIPNSFGA